MPKAKVEKVGGVWHWWCRSENCGGTGAWGYWSLANMEAEHHIKTAHRARLHLSRENDETAPGGIHRINWSD